MFGKREVSCLAFLSPMDNPVDHLGRCIDSLHVLIVPWVCKTLGRQPRNDKLRSLGLILLSSFPGTAIATGAP